MLNSSIPSLLVGDHTGQHLRAQRSYFDSVEVQVSAGYMAMSYRLEPAAMRLLADYLNSVADLIDADPDPRARP